MRIPARCNPVRRIHIAHRYKKRMSPLISVHGIPISAAGIANTTYANKRVSEAIIARLPTYAPLSARGSFS